MKYLIILAATVLLMEMSSQAFAQSCYRHICVGQNVIDRNDKIGSVNKILEDKKIQVIVNGFYQNYRVSELSKETNALGDFVQGSHFIDGSNKIGAVDKLFENKKVRAIVNGFYRIYKVQELALEITEIGPFKEGVEFIDRNDKIGSVNRLFMNRKVQAIVNGFYRFYDVRELSKSVNKVGKFSVNTSFIDRNDRIGKVYKLFKNGRLQTIVNGFYRFYDASDIVIEVKTIGGFVNGTDFVDRNDRIGKVSKIFENGRLQTIVNGFYRFYDADDLYKQVSSLNQFNVGTSFIDRNDRTGKIHKLFENKRVQTIVNGFYRFYDINQIYEETSKHDIYTKETYYAVDEKNVAKVSKFFSNGRIQLVTVSGFYRYANKLFLEIDRLGTATAGVRVTDSLIREAKILAVFENGVTLIEYEKVDDEGNISYVKGSAKLTTPEELNKIDAVAWMRSLILPLEDDRLLMAASNLVVETASLRALLQKLEVYLEKDEVREFFTNEEIEKVKIRLEELGVE